MPRARQVRRRIFNVCLSLLFTRLPVCLFQPWLLASTTTLSSLGRPPALWRRWPNTSRDKTTKTILLPCPLVLPIQTSPYDQLGRTLSSYKITHMIWQHQQQQTAFPASRWNRCEAIRLFLGPPSIGSFYDDGNVSSVSSRLTDSIFFLLLHFVMSSSPIQKKGKSERKRGVCWRPLNANCRER